MTDSKSVSIWKSNYTFHLIVETNRVHVFSAWTLFIISSDFYVNGAGSLDYETIYERAQASFIEKKSEFIGYISPVKDANEAIAFVNEIRAMHRKATHNVYAYILREQNTARYSDDGEPQGTAGVPVLDVLKKEGLTDICCVVTRYFGGILLGGGGLIRAYSHSAKLAVDSAQRMIMCASYKVEVTVDYNLYGKITYILPEFEIKLLDSVFEIDVKISFLVKIALYAPLFDKLVDLANGQIRIVKSDELFEDFA